VKVLDFGISKTVTQDVEMTTTLAVLGSPTYMSPEQMRSARSVDARADLWSLGVILYRLLTAKLPFSGENVTELIANVLSTTATPPSELRPELPKELDAVVLRCLERDPAGRYPNALELARDLMPFAPPHASAAFDRLGIASAASGTSPITLSSSPSLRSMASVLAPAGPATRSTGPSAAGGPPSASAPSVGTGPSGVSGVAGVSASSLASGAPAMPASSAITGPTGDAPVTLGSRASWGNTTPPPSTAPGASRRTIALAMVGASLVGVALALFVWRLESPVVAAAAPLPSASASAAVSAASAEPSAAVVIASAVVSAASAEPSASAAAPAVAETSEPAASKPEPKSVRTPHVTKPKTPADPFGRDRK
jgi:serine/threonine-protein kinase